MYTLRSSAKLALVLLERLGSDPQGQRNARKATFSCRKLYADYRLEGISDKLDNPQVNINLL